MPGSPKNPRPGEAKLSLKFATHNGEKVEIDTHVSLEQFKRITEIVFENKDA